jgi:hypothetical protein
VRPPSPELIPITGDYYLVSNNNYGAFDPWETSLEGVSAPSPFYSGDPGLTQVSNGSLESIAGAPPGNLAGVTWVDIDFTAWTWTGSSNLA